MQPPPGPGAWGLQKIQVHGQLLFAVTFERCQNYQDWNSSSVASASLIIDHMYSFATSISDRQEDSPRTMSRLSDLVHDTRLNTSIEDNITIHQYDESDDENDARSTLRSERWEQTNHLGRGGYGDVWLQQCVSGKRGYERRAVKIISRLYLKDKDNYMAELEAIAKFSQRRVSLKTVCHGKSWLNHMPSVFQMLC